jgi:hypothetical protein
MQTAQILCARLGVHVLCVHRAGPCLLDEQQQSSEVNIVHGTRGAARRTRLGASYNLHTYIVQLHDR